MFRVFASSLVLCYLGYLFTFTLIYNCFHVCGICVIYAMCVVYMLYMHMCVVYVLYRHMCVVYVLYMHMCVVYVLYRHMCGVCIVYAHVWCQRRCWFTSHSLPYSSETGSFAGPGARLAATKPQLPSCFHLL